MPPSAWAPKGAEDLNAHRALVRVVPIGRARVLEVGPQARRHALLGQATPQSTKPASRAGVPLVLVFPADKTSEPEMLPELLTADIILAALNKAAG